MISDIELARQRSSPSIPAMQKNLHHIGAALDTSYCELARDLSLPKLDELAARLSSALTNLSHLRRAIIADQVEGHGTG